MDTTADTSGNVKLASQLNIIDNEVTMTAGKVELNDFDFVLLGEDTLIGASNTAYFVTNNALSGGKFQRPVSQETVLFPVGLDTSYTPVTLTKTAGMQEVQVGVVEGVRDDITSGSYACGNVVEQNLDCKHNCRFWLCNRYRCYFPVDSRRRRRRLYPCYFYPV